MGWTCRRERRRDPASGVNGPFKAVNQPFLPSFVLSERGGSAPTVDSLADAASAYLKEVELAAGMQTKAGDRAVARRLNNLELAFAALRRSLAPAKSRPGLSLKPGARAAVTRGGGTA